MDDQRLFNNQIFSFLEELITRESNKQFFREDARKYRDLLKQCIKIHGADKNDIRCLCYCGKSNTNLLQLFDPYTDIEPELKDENIFDATELYNNNTKIDNDNTKIDNDKEIIIDVNDDNEITTDSLIRCLDDNSSCKNLQLTHSGTRQRGGMNKHVSFDKKIIDVNDKPFNTNKKNKLEIKLKSGWAEQIKDLGKQLGIKPESGKKFLTKSYVTNKILDTPRLQNKALKILKSDTDSES